MTYLLDTNVVSEMTKRHRDPGVAAWLETINGPTLYLSVLVMGEIRKGIELARRHDPVRAAAHEAWLTRLQAEFALRILPVTTEVAEEWGRFNAIRPIPVVDGLMAATARTRNWALVTRNVKDFNGLDLRIINPFDWPA
ncbi:type II toxin-antitoxin system VapC family toxin [Nonomuraea sp. NPDC050547]|uniref:type II toxin-antitoxin system VapC family toxin n=1 Tax=Nonomuraea sp. NPDC050547 TaxID=3364368 RepID=UPI0037A3309B